ncbi:MAG: energy-coupled thiamine transporter ThiT [Clostridia bacterium]|nr:energy-coupled thiamine transporter ThiT [Clostridia bacterium]
MQKHNTKRLATSGIMLAMATALAAITTLIPFFSQAFGGSFTFGSMLPIVVVSYMYGVKWGLFTSGVYAVIQIVMDLMLGKGSVILALFLPSSEDYMGVVAAILILLIDYVVAYTVLGLGGVFRKRVKSKPLSLVLGSVVALSLRYLAHIVSGYVFYGAWAEWFFSEPENAWIGEKVLSVFSGNGLALVYSICYNGIYMIPEIIVTAILAVVVSRVPTVKLEA